MHQINFKQRNALTKSKRLVVKIGSRILVERTGKPDLQRIKALVEEIAKLRQSNKEIVIVSSGAIAAGMEKLGIEMRPQNLPQLQMAAAVGQVRLMSYYDRFFTAEGCKVGQVLVTHDDLKNRTRHLNARNTILELLREKIIPIINENDVVSVDEIKFGDNDILAALVTVLIEAEALLLLTTTDGLHNDYGMPNSQRIAFLSAINRDILGIEKGKGSNLALGGMKSKLQSAAVANHIGARVVIADGRKKGIISKVLQGEDTGTLIMNYPNSNHQKINGRKRWIAFFHRTHGTIFIDKGAEEAIEVRGNSLLPIGIKKIEGEFDKGTLVNIKSEEGLLIAKGLVSYSSQRLEKIKGCHSAEIGKILGFNDYDEVIHRDNMVIFQNKDKEVA
jgi:glutamate 5-kinase